MRHQKVRIMKMIFGWTAGVLMLGATLTTHGGLIAAWTIDNPDYNTVYIGLSPNNDVTYNPGGVSASLTGTGNGIDVGNVFGTGGTTLNDPRSPQSATYALFAAYRDRKSTRLNSS